MPTLHVVLKREDIDARHLADKVAIVLRLAAAIPHAKACVLQGDHLSVLRNPDFVARGVAFLMGHDVAALPSSSST